MALVHHPTFLCPFPPALNPHIATIPQATLAWARRFKLTQHGDAEQRLERLRYSLLMAQAYPRAPLETLQVISDWNTWLFFLDDQCDETGMGRHPEQLEELHDRLLDVLQGNAPGDLHNPLLAALQDLACRFRACALEVWLERFVDQVVRYCRANVWEASNRMHGHIPDMATYLHMRPFTGAVFSYLKLIEFAEQFVLPSFVHEHPDIQRLERMTNNIICWSNDIISLEKELHHGDVHNLVLIMQHEQHLSLQEAVDRVAVMHDNEVRSFIGLSERLPSFGLVVDADLKRYVEGMRFWMRAHMEWVSATVRYNPVATAEG